jgi:hypothetical protein
MALFYIGCWIGMNKKELISYLQADWTIDDSEETRAAKVASAVLRILDANGNLGMDNYREIRAMLEKVKRACLGVAKKE